LGNELLRTIRRTARIYEITNVAKEDVELIQVAQANVQGSQPPEDRPPIAQNFGLLSVR
jgi:hypothetical protein